MEAIQEGEGLWRDVYREKQKVAAKAQRVNSLTKSIFRPQGLNESISTNRYDYVSLEYATERGDHRTEGIAGSDRVEGWLVVAVRDASQNRREVEAAPEPGNCYHADIILPDDHAANWEDIEVHALELLSLSQWQDRFGPVP